MNGPRQHNVLFGVTLAIAFMLACAVADDEKQLAEERHAAEQERAKQVKEVTYADLDEAAKRMTAFDRIKAK